MFKSINASLKELNKPVTEIKEKSIIVSSPFSSEDSMAILLMLIFLFIGSIVCTVIGFASEAYIVTSALAVGLLCFTGFGLFLIYLLSLKNIKVTPTQIILSSGLRKEEEIIERKEIVSFYEAHFIRRGRGRREYDELALYTDKKLIIISSEVYVEYKQLKEILTKDLPTSINKNIVEKRSDLYLALIFVGISFVTSILCINSLITNWLEEEYEEGLNISAYLVIGVFISFVLMGIYSWEKYKRILYEQEI